MDFGSWGADFDDFSRPHSFRPYSKAFTTQLMPFGDVLARQCLPDIVYGRPRRILGRANFELPRNRCLQILKCSNLPDGAKFKNVLATLQSRRTHKPILDKRSGKLMKSFWSLPQRKCKFWICANFEIQNLQILKSGLQIQNLHGSGRPQTGPPVFPHRQQPGGRPGHTGVTRTSCYCCKFWICKFWMWPKFKICSHFFTEHQISKIATLIFWRRWNMFELHYFSSRVRELNSSSSF